MTAHTPLKEKLNNKIALCHVLTSHASKATGCKALHCLPFAQNSRLSVIYIEICELKVTYSAHV